MTTAPGGEPGEQPEVVETGVGWPGPPVRPATRSPRPPAEPPGTAERDPATSHRGAAVRRFRQEIARDRAPPVRPGTVTAAAVILFVGAGLAVLGCCGVTYLTGEASLSSGEQNLIMLFSAILLGSAALNAVLGYFILQGRQWARVTAIVLCVLGVLGSLVNQFASFGDAEATGPLTTCVGVILNIVVISLLSGQQASHYFRFANA